MNITETHRPTSFADVIGQDHVIKSLTKVLEKKSHSTFLFEGPSGVGKTTLARICSLMLESSETIEFDAASNSGVEEMRGILKTTEHFPMGTGSRVIIIDECHMLSKSAWNALLKATEEPRERNYWIFCTTEISKVPSTVRTRSAQYKLKPVPADEISTLLKEVRDAEAIAVDDVLADRIAGSSGGSVRQALVTLQQADGLTEDAYGELTAPEQSLPMAFNLAQLLGKPSWDMKEAMALCTELKDESPEGVRQVVRAYFTTFVMRSPGNSYALGVLSEFEKPAVDQNRITDIVMRLARINKWRK